MTTFMYKDPSRFSMTSSKKIYPGFSDLKWFGEETGGELEGCMTDYRPSLDIRESPRNPPCNGCSRCSTSTSLLLFQVSEFMVRS